MTDRYVGVYWTLPVNWLPFRDLPADVDAAAAASRTIRYQRVRVRRYVDEAGGKLVAEIAFMDTRTDRATEAVRDVLRRNQAGLTAARPTLLAVRFDDPGQWRPNPFLDRAAADLGLDLIGLPPDPLVIDGETFDPARHFAAWRKCDGAAMAGLRYAAEAALTAVLTEIPAGNGRWAAVAALLNGRDVRTIRGGHWTAENARKLAGRRASES